MPQQTTRRQFLQHSTAGAAALGVGYLSGRAPAASRSPNEKLNIGIIGCGGRGESNTNDVAGEHIVAVCDVDDRHVKRAAGRFADAKSYNDFRELIEQANLDAVVISSTDFTHAPAAVRAMRRGLHVYCEKPLGHSVEEARIVRETYVKARADKGIATQMGTQIHATDNYRRVVELVQGGAIGNVSEAHVWCNRLSSQAPPPSNDAKPPAYLHWDLWLGPVSDRPFRHGYMPGNLTWNRYWDFGNGILGDMGSHLIDLPYWALDLQFPTSAEAEAPPADPVIYPTQLIVRWEHPKRGDGPHQQPCTVAWYDGQSKPANLKGIDVSGYGIGALFVGEKGTLLADYGKRTVLPKVGEPQANATVEKPWIAPSLGQHQEWLHACKTGEPTLCNFEYSGRLIEHNLLGAVAHRVGKKLQWDHENLKATNAPEADKFIRKQYRAGWELTDAKA